MSLVALFLGFAAGKARWQYSLSQVQCRSGGWLLVDVFWIKLAQQVWSARWLHCTLQLWVCRAVNLRKILRRPMGSPVNGDKGMWQISKCHDASLHHGPSDWRRATPYLWGEAGWKFGCPLSGTCLKAGGSYGSCFYKSPYSREKGSSSTTSGKISVALRSLPRQGAAVCNRTPQAFISLKCASWGGGGTI